MTKAELISAILQNSKSVDRSQIQEILESFFSTVKDNMEKGESIYIRGFGSFFNKKRAQKVAQNIKKKEKVVVPEHFVPAFKPAKEFSDLIRQNVSVAAEEAKNQDERKEKKSHKVKKEKLLG